MLFRSFIGKTVILINLCDGLERVYMLESTVDGQIPMEDIEEGFYEVYVMINLQRHRVLSEEIFRDSFTTIRRNGSFSYIDVIADRFLLEALLSCPNNEFVKGNRVQITKSFFFKERPQIALDV